jgi:membrane protease YdiL (CAAX protease family)
MPRKPSSSPIGYGLVLGWARLRSGGLAASVLLHATINFVASAPLWWPLVAGA